MWGTDQRNKVMKYGGPGESVVQWPESPRYTAANNS